MMASLTLAAFLRLRSGPLDGVFEVAQDRRQFVRQIEPGIAAATPHQAAVAQ
jgi:hypothetical protein